MARFLVLPALLLLGLAAAPGAATAELPQHDSLWVEDGFLDAAQATELATRIPPVGSLRPFSQPVDVPASLYARLLSAFAPAGEAPAAAADAAAAESIVVPGRSESGHVGPHTDRWAGSKTMAGGKVGLVYLAGDGQMAFTHKETGEKTVVGVKPGRLLAWDNAAYTHTLVAGGATRAMLGPMAFKAGGFHEVGVPGWWEVYSQLHLGKTLVPRPGSVIKATANIIPTEWKEPDSWSWVRALEGMEPDVGDLVITLSHNAPAGQLTYVKASIIVANKRSPKLRATQAGNAVTFTIPADEVQTMKEVKLAYTYRLAKGAAAGTKIDFTLTPAQAVAVAITGDEASSAEMVDPDEPRQDRLCPGCGVETLPVPTYGGPPPGEQVSVIVR
jgi:hypothetical protein